MASLVNWFGGANKRDQETITNALLSPLQICIRRVKSVTDPRARVALACQALSDIEYQAPGASFTYWVAYSWTMEEFCELLDLLATRNDKGPLDGSMDEVALETLEGCTHTKEATSLATLDPRAHVLGHFLCNRSLISVEVDNSLHMKSDDDCLAMAVALATKHGISGRATAYITLIFCSVREVFLFNADGYARRQRIENAWMRYTASNMPERPRFHCNQFMFAVMQQLYRPNYRDSIKSIS